jgi:hypothetical protein
VKILKSLLPAFGILAAVSFMYWYIRRNMITGPAQSQGPNPSSSTGLPNYTVPLYNDARTVTEAPSIDNSTHPIIFAGDTSAVGNPYQGGNFGDINQGDLNMPMNRLTYNMYPVGIESPATTSKACGCGYGGGCTSCVDDCSTPNSRFPDGRGGCLSRSRDQVLDTLIHNPVAIPRDKFEDLSSNPRGDTFIDRQAECGPGYVFNGTACVRATIARDTTDDVATRRTRDTTDDIYGPRSRDITDDISGLLASVQLGLPIQ